MPHTSPTEKVPVASPVCPGCGSPSAQTTSKTVDASTYWRCQVCGEIWNALRREKSGRPYYRR